MIEVRSNYRPERQRIDVYVFDPVNRVAHIYEPGGPDRMENVVPGAEIPVYLSLPEDTVLLIQRALEGETWKMPQPATAHHLEDAITVRDRLLVLVEQFVKHDIVTTP